MTAQLSPAPVFRSWDNLGFPLVGGKLFTYAAGTTTPQATYVDSTQTTPNTNPVILNFRGEAFVWLDPLLSYKFVLQDALGNLIWTEDNIQGAIGVARNIIPSQTNTFTLGTPTVTFANAYFGPNGAAAFDPITGNIGYYAQTPAETAAIAAGFNAPVDKFWPPGYVDRYLTNTGTNDMASAFSTVGQVASRTGCKARWGASAPYHLNTPVNWTGIHGVIFEDESGGAASASAFNTIIIGHNGIAFDIATSYELTFNNMVVATASGSVPKTLFFSARNVALSGCGIHRFNNLRTPTTLMANFVWYGYGSEENIFTSCECFNNQPGSGLFSHNGTNPSNFTSTFVSIATGAQSNTVNRHLGSSYFNTGNSGSHNEVVFQLEDTADFTFRDGLWGCAHGDAYVQVIGTQASIRLNFDSIRGEPLGTQPAHGVDVTAVTGTHVQWTFNNVSGDCSGFFLVFAAGASVQNLAMRATSATSGNLLLAYNMSNSVIETLVDSVVEGQTGGTVSSNVFIGGRNNITANGGTFSGNLYADNFAGGFGVDSDLFTSAATACTGALTTSISYQIRLSPNGKQVTLNLPAIQGTTTAAASFTLGVAIPALYRPAGNLRQLCAIEDSGGTLNQPGQVFVTASTGVIIVFKDIVGTGNWTNGQTGGLAAETEVSWNL